MPKPKLAMVLLIVMVVSVPISVFADAVFWGCGYKPQTLSAGTLSCFQEVKDCRKMLLSCKQGDRPLFTVDEFADTVAISDDGKFIVGLSNRGSTNAYWIRDTQGKLIQAKAHDQSIHYCLESVTNVRQWFDKNNPQVKIKSANGQLVEVTVRGCDGKELLIGAR